MVFSIGPGNVLRFVGLELFNFLGLVGSTLPFIRQSPGGRVNFIDCIKWRRVGLPTDAALTNMRLAARSASEPGPQLVYTLPNYTYSTTRSPGVPVTLTKDLVLQLNYVVDTPIDSSLAFQGLHFGGYVYSVYNSLYHPDNVVAQSCLDRRPGDECVADYIRQLDAQEAAAQEAAAASASSRLSTTDTIVVAVVVPVGIVLLTALVAAVVLTRRRRARAAAYASSAPGKANGASNSGSQAVAGVLPSAARSSDIFMGFEPDAAPPVWTQQHDEEAAAEFATATYVGDAESCDEVPALNGDTTHTAGAANGGASDAADAAKDAVSPGGTATPARQRTSDRITRTLTGGLRPAFAAAQWGPDRAAGPQGDTAKLVSLPPGSGGALVSSTGGAANGNGSQSTQPQEGQGVQQPAAATQGPSSRATLTEGTAEESVVVQPAEAPRPSDVAEELARMAREVRMQVKDVTIRIDTVLGTGAFGVVYGGIWQGIPVAVKTVIISASQERRKRALHEAALCQSIVHPNIIATYACELQPIGAPVASASSGDGATTDSGRTGLASMMPQIVDWRLYIIQELADGGPLSKLYGRPDIWPAPSATQMVPVVAMALGIARALTHLHSKRIIHGDLSPNNVMLKHDSSEPSGYTIKVGDFGLSVMLPHNQSHLSNLRMGTMFYMCPAVILKGQVGPASDVFSLGVILWELYHGRRAGVRTKEGPRYASIFPAFPPSCPRAYVNITLNCLQRQPANRPTAEVVAEHLSALLQSLAAPGP
ncbi:hypothetical protein CHLRE_02g087800v5 [Chlamydomonas reinhardtii]|uniref:Protein kinase domain-containing protein n=1 Tax=Chlamydomonas reinhardtii TaxID=3055 RepID=A0A2K3E114_CHLRE|nr:uncharacterized protein CHLRE_02g087800v5 [Chlamydomonas reinhardtii]PNW86472.1 hypothetical protein CHLRE_02g087800v5 [Chlamydomonas reinhardtii]